MFTNHCGYLTLVSLALQPNGVNWGAPQLYYYYVLLLLFFLTLGRYVPEGV